MTIHPSASANIITPLLKSMMREFQIWINYSIYIIPILYSLLIISLGTPENHKINGIRPPEQAAHTMIDWTTGYLYFKKAKTQIQLWYHNFRDKSSARMVNGMKYCCAHRVDSNSNRMLLKGSLQASEWVWGKESSQENK